MGRDLGLGFRLRGLDLNCRGGRKEKKEDTKKKSEVLSNMDDNMNRVSKRRNNIDENGSNMLQAKKPKK